MKALIKLVIFLALAHAVVRTGLVALGYFQLKDAAQQEATWGDKVSPADIASHVMEKAMELGVPLEPGSVDVSRDANTTVIDVAYTQPIELLPAFVYPVIYPAELSFSVQARTMTGLK
jgi:hypothetical protein